MTKIVGFGYGFSRTDEDAVRGAFTSVRRPPKPVAPFRTPYGGYLLDNEYRYLVARA